MIELVTDVNVSLVDCLASDDMVAMAAWVSHDQDSEERLENRDGVGKLINFLMRQKHMSPFEHGTFIFKVDVPLFVAREFHRHRTFSYNEVSGRYTEMAGRFYVADKARVQHGKPGDYYFEEGSAEQTAIYRTSKWVNVQRAWNEYQRRLEYGIAKEQAREDLPLSLMTQFYATANPRNVMQFLTLRNEKHALKEIRDVAGKMEEIFAEHMPLTARAYRKYRKRDAWAAAQPESAWNDILIESVDGSFTISGDGSMDVRGKIQPVDIHVSFPTEDEYANVDKLADKITQRLANRAFDRRDRR